MVRIASRVLAPITPSIFPTSNPRRARSCCSSFVSRRLTGGTRRVAGLGRASAGAGGGRADKTRRVVGRRGGIDQGLVPFEIDVEIRVGQEGGTIAAHGGMQPDREAVGGDRRAARIGNAVLRPERARLLNGDVGLVPR